MQSEISEQDTRSPEGIRTQEAHEEMVPKTGGEELEVTDIHVPAPYNTRLRAGKLIAKPKGFDDYVCD